MIENLVIMAVKPKEWLLDFLFDGEILLHRTLRQVKNYCNKIWVTCSHIGQHNIDSKMEIINNLNGNDLGCMYGVKHLNSDLFLFGDVYYTDNAINLIMNEITGFYGRSNKSLAKYYGEMFAIRSSPKLWQDLDILWEQYTNNTIKRLWSWDLYGKIQGKSYYKHGITGNWTEINDATDDFDKEEELFHWSNVYNIPINPNFDDDFYLSKHQDVKQHVPMWFSNGYEHYIKYGKKEGREKRRLI